MARNSPPITIQEIPGDQFPSLDAAQQSARAYIASDLANLLRHMLESGALEIRDGRILPKG
jgi:hypothetical protein